MGRIGTFRSATSEDVDGDKQIEIRADFGGDDPLTGPLYGPAGIVSAPVEGDLIVFVKLDGKGEYAAVGAFDAVHGASVKPGEISVVARNGDGDTVASITLLSDGTVSVENDEGLFELSAQGSFKASNNSGLFELKTNGQFSANGHLTVDP